MDDDIHQHLRTEQYSQAFEALLERYRDKVFRLACSILRNETTAEDLAQDIFVRIWKALPGYSGQAAPSTCIYTIARNACLSHLKRQRPTVSLNDPDVAGALEGQTQFHLHDIEGGVELDALQLLAQLPDKYRRVIPLFYLEQKSYEEVAAMLGLPMGTVKTFIYRARKELQRLGARSEIPIPIPC